VGCIEGVEENRREGINVVEMLGDGVDFIEKFELLLGGLD